jgi:hypothetical protein
MNNGVNNNILFKIRLLFKGKELYDEYNLNYYDIENNCIIQAQILNIQPPNFI